MKKLAAILAALLSFVLCLGGVNPAYAQQATATQPPSRGITTFYVTPEQQAEGVKVYRDILKYDVAIPNLDLSAMLPENLSDFPAAYKQVLEAARQKNGINGSFTQGWFDFQGASAVVPGTNTLFTIDAPAQGRIYSVVAGLPASQCPVKIAKTSISFFENVADAESKAKELAAQKYLVYVSPVDALTISAFSQIFYDQTTGKKKTDANCFLVSGATEDVKTDFTKIFYLLPPQLQQPARQQPFEFNPRTGDSIFLVNARKSLSPLPPANALKYGEIYNIQNGYAGFKGGFLDTRATGCQGNVYCVSTATSTNRDSGSGSWKIVSKKGSADNGKPVLANDEFYLQNQYGNATYLDTRGAGCNDDKYCVSTATSTNRDIGSGTWKIIPSNAKDGFVTLAQEVVLQNGYANFQGGFLDTRGAGCQSNAYCVSTAIGPTRDSGSTLWKFIK